MERMAADKQKPTKKGGQRGRSGKHFKPTQADRLRVMRLAALGLNQNEIAMLIFHRYGDDETTPLEDLQAINRQTLAKHFSAELKMGVPAMVEAVGGNIHRMARKRQTPLALAAGKFLLTHRAGWTSRDRIEEQQERQAAGEKAREVLEALGQMDRETGGELSSEWRERERAEKAARKNGHKREAAAGGNGHEGNGNGRS